MRTNDAQMINTVIFYDNKTRNWESLWILYSILVNESETATWLHHNLVNEVTHKPQLETNIATG